MSLINDALKKAQKQRSQDLLPAGAPGSATTKNAASGKLSSPAKSRSIRPAVILGLCAVLLSGVSIGTTLFILHSDSGGDPAPAKKLVTAAANPSTPKTSVSVAPPASAPANSAPIPTSAFVAPVAVTPAPAPAIVSVEPKVQLPTLAIVPPTFGEGNAANLHPLESAPPKPTETDAVAFHPRPPETPKANMRIQGVIDKLRVAGIRVSDTESKVILNERLYRLNDVVDPALGLRLTVVELHALTFTDEAGATYVKLF